MSFPLHKFNSSFSQKLFFWTNYLVTQKGNFWVGTLIEHKEEHFEDGFMYHKIPQCLSAFLQKENMLFPLLK